MIAFYSLKLKAKQPFAQVVGSIKLLLKNNKMSIKIILAYLSITLFLRV